MTDTFKEAKEDDAEANRGHIVVQVGKPLEIKPATPNSDVGAPSPLVAEATAVADALKAYRAALHELTTGKYGALAQQLPCRLRQQEHVFVFWCTNGVVVRYEACPPGDKPRVRCGVTKASVEELLPGVSEGVIHLSRDPASHDIGPDGPGFVMAKTNHVTGTSEELMRLRPVAFSDPDGLVAAAKSDGSRPTPFIAMTNEVEISLRGAGLPNEVGAREIAKTEEFVARGPGFCPWAGKRSRCSRNTPATDGTRSSRHCGPRSISSLCLPSTT
jgi:hypothetical protein